MKSGAFKITATYMVVGFLWIALSDKILDIVKGEMDISLILFISSIKGYLYVLVTGAILYRLILWYNSRLAESEKQYSRYFESNPTPMWIYNRRALNFTAVNNAAIAKYGYTTDEFLNMSILDIRPKSDAGKVYTVVKELKDAYNDSGVWTHLKKCGTPMRVHITSHVITSGKEHHIMAMATEVVTPPNIIAKTSS
jgi:PAS domain S-box-containing protein